MSVNSIVQLLVSQQVAPTPATLQQCGAIISQGATNTSQFTASYLTQLSDLTSLLTGTKAVTSATWLTGTATITTTAPHGFTNGDSLWLTLAGFSPAAWNGSYLCTVTGASTFTFALASNPGAMTVAGTYTEEDVAEVLAAATTFFGQGSTTGISVLELGPGNPNDGVAALTTYLTNNPNSAYTAGATGYFYSYLVPRTWDGNANFLALIASYEAPSAKTYFYVTTTLQNYGLYTNLMKCVKLFVEDPAYGVWSANALTAATYASGQVTLTTTTAHGVAVGQWFKISGMTPAAWNGWYQAQLGTTGSTLIANVLTNPGTETALGTLVASYYASAGIPTLEFSAASDLWVNLNRKPSTTNKVTPNRFGFVYGVTPFPVQGNSSLLYTLSQANVNYIGLGYEGGISGTMIVPGTTMDGNDFTYWYSVDWVQLNCDLMLSNAVINGSNNPINPLYYNQAGIDRLQAVAAQVLNNGITFGMVLGPVVQTQLDGPVLAAAIAAGTYNGMTVINAVPFLTYSQENPTHYKIGLYQGLSIYYVPARGFANILINLTVSNIVAS